MDTDHPPQRKNTGRHWPNSDVASKNPARKQMPNASGPLPTSAALPQGRRAQHVVAHSVQFERDINPSLAQARSIAVGIELPAKSYQCPQTQQRWDIDLKRKGHKFPWPPADYLLRTAPLTGDHRHIRISHAARPDVSNRIAVPRQLEEGQICRGASFAHHHALRVHDGAGGQAILFAMPEDRRMTTLSESPSPVRNYLQDPLATPSLPPASGQAILPKLTITADDTPRRRGN